MHADRTKTFAGRARHFVRAVFRVQTGGHSIARLTHQSVSIRAYPWLKLSDSVIALKDTVWNTN